MATHVFLKATSLNTSLLVLNVFTADRGMYWFVQCTLYILNKKDFPRKILREIWRWGGNATQNIATQPAISIASVEINTSQQAMVMNVIYQTVKRAKWRKVEDASNHPRFSNWLHWVGRTIWFSCDNQKKNAWCQRALESTPPLQLVMEGEWHKPYF